LETGKTHEYSAALFISVPGVQPSADRKSVGKRRIKLAVPTLHKCVHAFTQDQHKSSGYAAYAWMYLEANY
jgi:hypothetical protein